jgi:hypothetical protein
LDPACSRVSTRPSSAILLLCLPLPARTSSCRKRGLFVACVMRRGANGWYTPETYPVGDHIVVRVALVLVLRTIVIMSRTIVIMSKRITRAAAMRRRGTQAVWVSCVSRSASWRSKEHTSHKESTDRESTSCRCQNNATPCPTNTYHPHWLDLYGKGGSLGRPLANGALCS